MCIIISFLRQSPSDKIKVFYSKHKKVVLTAVKRQQIAELKALVSEIDPNAFIIVQEAHQVLGDGFARYSKESL